MSTPSIRQVLGTAGSSTISVSTTSQTDVDDLLIVIHQTAWRDDGDLVEPTGTSGIAGWVSFEQESTGNFDADVYMRCWRARVTSAGSKFIEMDPPSGSNTNSMIVLVLTGVDHSDPIDGTTSTAGSGGSSFPVGGITTTGTDSLLVGSWAAYGSGVGSNGLTAPASMTERRENNHSSNNAHMCATQALTSAGSTGSRTASTANSVSGWAAVLFAVRSGGQTVSPVSIPTLESFGRPAISQPSLQTISPVSIPSAESVPSDLILSVEGPQTITFPGEGAIHSGEAFGRPTITITADPRTRRREPRRQLGIYELMAIARVPQSSGPPLLIEVDPIDPTRLTHTEELSRAPQLEVGCKVSTLTDQVVERLKNMAELPTELLLYRDGVPVFAGPLLGWRVQGEFGDELSLQAAGLLGYLRFMYITSDLTFDQVDQFEIATSLIDHWQDQEYGHFGIDTTGIPSSGVNRYVEYSRDELHNIGQRVQELGERENGFDVAIDPGSRKLVLGYPQQGVDRSAGPDAIVFDDRNVRSASVVASAAPGDIASEAFGTGEDGRYSSQSNSELRSKFGRVAIAQSFSSVEEQHTLDTYTSALLATRDEALVAPGPNARVTEDTNLSAYDVGDTIAYTVHNRLVCGRSVFRIRKRTVAVSSTGQESVSLEFV